MLDAAFGLRPGPAPERFRIATAVLDLLGRDIAQRLYLSHRTISTHLYRTFPKLGITSRGELRSALSARTARAAGK